MTPEERARDAWRGLTYDDNGRVDPDEVVEAIADAIRAAVVEEREACIQAIESTIGSCRGTREAALLDEGRQRAIAAIRARGTT